VDSSEKKFLPRWASLAIPNVMIVVRRDGIWDRSKHEVGIGRNAADGRRAVLNRTITEFSYYSLFIAGDTRQLISPDTLQGRFPKTMLSPTSLTDLAHLQ
jgi:hypothetical protein